MLLNHAPFKMKTDQNFISIDFDNDLFTFDVISIIDIASSEVGPKHGTR